MNRIKDLIIQFCKFGAVGGLCFGIDYGLMIFLTETHIMHYFASSAVSFTVSDRKSTRLNSSHMSESRMPSSA